MITIRQAQAVIAAGEAKAAAIGVPVNIAVLDAGAHLKAFSRMDGAVLGSIDVAHEARPGPPCCSRPPARPSGNTASPARRRPASNSRNGGLAPFAGGIPLLGPDGDDDRRRRCLRRRRVRRISRSPRQPRPPSPLTHPKPSTTVERKHS